MINILNILAQIPPPPPTLPQVEAGPPQVQTILQVLFAILGAVSVIVVTVAGMQYVLSNGDPGKAAKAKDTILYAVIGLAISILSFTIVTFMLDRVFG